MIQYPDHVIIICVDTHKHLRSVPPGANLRDDLINQAEKVLLDELGLDPKYVPDDEYDDE